MPVPGGTRLLTEMIGMPRCGLLASSGVVAVIGIALAMLVASSARSRTRCTSIALSSASRPSYSSASAWSSVAPASAAFVISAVIRACFVARVFSKLVICS